MSVKNIPFINGLNNVLDEEGLEIGGKNPSLFLKDALNVDINSSGRINIRKGSQLQTTRPFKYIWQSPLHRDVFGLHEAHWVKINPKTWEYEKLIFIGDEPIYHSVVNNQVYVSGREGIFYFNGVRATKLTITTPPSPYVSTYENGSFVKGDYTFAISWLVHGTESALSEIFKISVVDNQSFEINFPTCIDNDVTHVRLYMSDPNGSELKQYEDFSIDQLNLTITKMPELGRVAAFQFLSPMYNGKFLKLWKGRLVVVRSNFLYFSEAFAFHLIDERYNFIQFGQKITFIEVVESGIWVGLVDRVVFLSGNDVRNLVVDEKSSMFPVPNSSGIVQSDAIDFEISQGKTCALWLAENGYVIGNSTGQIIEMQSKNIKGVVAKNGTCVVLGKRVFTVVS